MKGIIATDVQKERLKL